MISLGIGTSSTLSRTHWANDRCVAWWIARPHLAGNAYWYETIAGNQFAADTLAFSGIEPYYWSPSGNGLASDTFTPRPGALSNKFAGPLTLLGTPSYTGVFLSNVDVNYICPNGGTCAFWYRPSTGASPGTASTTHVVLCQGNWWTGPVWGIWLVNTPPYEYFCGFSTTTTWYKAQYSIGSEWSMSNWIHLAFTWGASSTTKLYLNGALVATGATAAPSTVPSHGTPLLTVGKAWGANFGAASYSGIGPFCIDDLTFWSYQMTAAQMANVYAESSTGWLGRFSGTFPIVTAQQTVQQPNPCLVFMGEVPWSSLEGKSAFKTSRQLITSQLTKPTPVTASGDMSAIHLQRRDTGTQRTGQRVSDVLATHPVTASGYMLDPQAQRSAIGTQKVGQLIVDVLATKPLIVAGDLAVTPIVEHTIVSPSGVFPPLPPAAKWKQPASMIRQDVHTSEFEE